MSIFKQFLNLRDRISERALSNVDALNVITGVSLNPLTDNKLPVSGERTLEVLPGALNLYDSANNLIDNISYTDVAQLQTRIGDTSEQWGDLVNELSDGLQSYEVMGQLTTKYSYTNRVKYDDVMTYLTNANGSVYTDLSESLFTATDNDGYISRNSFTAVLNGWFSGAKSASDDDSYEVDKSNPYVLTSITRIVISAVSTLLSTMCVVLSQFFGAALLIIGYIVSQLTQLFSNMLEQQEVEIDMESSNQYVSGPIVWCEDIPSSRIFYRSDVQNHVWLSESNGVAIFMWPKSFTNQGAGYKCNAYLYPCWRVLETLKYLFETSNILEAVQAFELQDGPNRPYFQVNDPDALGKLWQSHTNLKYEDEPVIDKYQAGMSLVLGYFIQCFTANSLLNDGDATVYRWNVHGGSSELSTYENALLTNIAEFLCYYDWMRKNVDAHYYYNWDDFITYGNVPTIVDKCIQSLADYISHDVMSNGGKLLGGASDNDIAAVAICNDPYPGTTLPLTCPVIRAPICGNGAMPIREYSTVEFKLSDYYTYNDKLLRSDCLPTDFGITLPRYNASTVNDVLIATGLIITTAAIGSAIIKNVIKKKRIAKQALRTAALNDARDAYLEDPANPLFKKAYEDEVYKFNKYGKWFGWGQYDSGNGWMNYDNSSDTTSGMIMSDLLNKQQISETDVSLILRSIKG